MHEYDVETVKQSSEWRTKNLPKPKNPKYTEGTESHPCRDLWQVYGKLFKRCHENHGPVKFDHIILFL